MGFSNLAVVLGVISQVYSIDLQIKQWSRRKFDIAQTALNVQKMTIGQEMRTGANQAPPSQDPQSQAIKDYVAYVEKQLNLQEKEIDMILETLKAQRTALQQQREEYTKYTSEGIKLMFKNNYMG